jgi:hypothetical protein
MPGEQPERIELMDHVLVVVGNNDFHGFPLKASFDAKAVNRESGSRYATTAQLGLGADARLPEAE